MRIIGHEQTAETLRGFVDRGEMSHGYIFWGPDMIGKKTVAFALANYAEHHAFAPVFGPSGTQEVVLGDCLGVHPDKEKKIGIDAVRAIGNFLSQKPNRSRYRMVVVDKSQLLTPEAQDALLKVTEEPPQSAVLILVVNNPELLKSTLNSRLQKIYFAPVHRTKITEWLKEELSLTAARAEELARRALRQPGRAVALFKEKAFQELQDSARQFFGTRGLARRNFIKDLIKDEEFNLEEFLDALIAEVIYSKNFSYWHRLLALRDTAGHFNVNPRLQLENLMST